jgi:hypothetical protein
VSVTRSAGLIRWARSAPRARKKKGASAPFFVLYRLN